MQRLLHPTPTHVIAEKRRHFLPANVRSWSSAGMFSLASSSCFTDSTDADDSRSSVDVSLFRFCTNICIFGLWRTNND